MTDTPKQPDSDLKLPGKPKEQIAIAVTYDWPDKMAVPEVVAKGRGELAEKILKLAFENDIKVRQDAELAEILSIIELDNQIPLEAFTAMAEILSYIYRANMSFPKPPPPLEEKPKRS